MYEIELKAHVYDREKTISYLESLAKFDSKIIKNDTYYSLKTQKLINNKDHISIRIRKEYIQFSGTDKSEILVTYKKKEIRTNEYGTSIEVNEENECTVSDSSPLEKFLIDAGAVIQLKKEKITLRYTLQTHYGQANLELCTVPPLGDFLEIEILSDNNDNQTVEKIQNEIKNLIQKCGISLDCIEPKYYSEMLNQHS